MSQRIANLMGLVVVATILAGSGCFFGGLSRVHPPSISPSGSGSAAMEQYDTNKDGVVKGDELEKAPSLKSALARLDTNHDGGVSADEVAARVKAWQDSKVGKMSLSVTVTMDNVPLADAEVVFEPEKFLGTDIQTAKGKTDSHGVASLTVPVEGDDPPGVACGLYLIRVTKPGANIPAKYNTETILGRELALDTEEMQVGTVKIELTSK